MRGRRLAFSVALGGAAIVGSVTTIAVWGRGSTPAAPPSAAVSTTAVVRTDLTTSALTEGTLGYASTDPVENGMTGTYTWFPASGATISPGEVLYRVDNLPVILMAGSTPAWRTFALGMTDGPDVTELTSNLVALGAARGLFTAPRAHFSALTMDAVKRWQSANGEVATGQVSWGQIAFLPDPVLVGAENIAVGQMASPGEAPYQVTTTTRTVTVPLNPNFPSVSVGEAVSIVLPTNVSTPGKITAIGPVSQGTSSGAQGSSAGSGGSGNSAQSQATARLTVTPDQPAATGTGSGLAVQVSLTTQSATGVLAVPIAALLALAGGGYGVEVVGFNGTHHLVGVTTGVFTGSQVQVTGAGIAAGTKVVVAQ